MKHLQILKNNEGITLIEMLITMAVSSVLVIATAITVTSVTQWGKSSENSSTAYDMMISVGRNFQSSTAWSRTVSDPANASMDCLVNHTDCRDKGGAFRLLDDNGTLVYDPSVVGAGGKLAGFGNGGLCSSFDKDSESSSCPYRYEMTWTPQCPATGTCINPAIKVSAEFVSSKSSSSSAIAMNSNNYSITYDMGSFNPVAPVLTPSLIYTNKNQSVTANVLTILGSAESAKIINLSAPAHGTVSQGSGGLVTYTPAADYHGLDTFNATIQAPNGSRVTATVYAKVMTKFSWTGASSDANWTSPLNWCGLVVNNACSNTSSIPAAGDTAIFDTSCTRNCNANINQAVSLGGIEIDKGFKATLTQMAGSSIGLSSTGYNQADGSFTGSNAGIFISGSDFVQTGGSFLAPQANLETQGNFIVNSTAQFNNNNGTVTVSLFAMWPPPVHVVNTGGHDLNNLYFKANTDIDLSATQTNVKGKLTLGNNAWTALNNGTLNAYGDIDVFGPTGGQGSAIVRVKGNILGQVVSGLPDPGGGFGSISNFVVEAASDQKVDMNGHLMFQSAWLASGFYKIMSGIVSIDPAATIEFTGFGNMDIVTGGIDYPSVAITAERSNPRFDFNGAVVNVNGDLTLATAAGSGGCLAQVFNGELKAHGNIVVGKAQIPSVSDEKLCGGWGDLMITAAGNPAGQTITSVAGSSMSNLTIDSMATQVKLVGDLTMTSVLSWSGPNLNGNLLYKTGSFVTAGANITFTGWLNPITFIPGNVNYDSITFNGSGGAGVDLSGGVVKVKTLALANSEYHSVPQVNNGTIAVTGDVTVSNQGMAGTAVVQIAGSSSQKITAIGTGTSISNLEINNSSGVALVGEVGVSGGWNAGSFKNTSNTALDMSAAGSKLVFSGNSTLSILPGTVAYKAVDFKMGGDDGTATLGGNKLIVSGLLNLWNTCNHRCGVVNNGTLSALGDVSMVGPGDAWNPNQGAGDVSLRFEGSGAQKLTQNGAVTTGPVVVNTTGTLTLGTNVSFSASSSATLQSGLINLAGFSLTVPGSLNLSGNILTKSSGVLVVNGVVAGTGNLYAGTVNP